MSGIRDSILAAHGGDMEEDALRAEMRKVFERMRGPEQPAAVVKPASKAGQNTRFGIQNIFPELQKTSSTVTRQRSRGRVWILTSAKKLEPVFVVTGISDGRYTEVSGPALKAGDQVVLGATSQAAAKSAQAANPLTPGGGGQRPMGGGPR